MTPIVLTAIAVVFTLAPSVTSAITWQEIVSLSRAGVSSHVIIALIERDRTVFPITPDQVTALKNEGVGEDVLIAMLASGPKGQPDQGPIVVVVGSGPDRPNATSFLANRLAAPPDTVVPYLVPYVVAVPYFLPVTVRSPCAVRSAAKPPSPSPSTGIFFTTPFRGLFFDPAEPEAPSRGRDRSAGRSSGLPGPR